MRREIEFVSAGVVCRGWLQEPVNRAGKPWPTVVMAHGFSAVKEMALDRFAAAFADAGLASVVFDYRGFGASDGTPRQDPDPHEQVADYRNAISFARSLPDVEADRIGIWGTSYSGGHVLVVAAMDRRVKAVVSQVPLIDGWESFGRLIGAAGLNDLVQQLIAERERLYGGAPPAMIPVVDDGGQSAVMGTPDAFEWFLRAAKSAPTWRNEVTFRSLERLLEYTPGASVERIAPTPLLMIAAEQDFLPLDLARAAFARAGSPKRLSIIPAGHFAPYDPPHFAGAAREAVDWFTTYLAPAATGLAH